MNYFDFFGERKLPTKKTGEFVRSKGEQKIANLLWDNEILYEYESDFLGVHPDFLVYTPDGKVCVWEYVGPGMLKEDDYFERLRYKFDLFKNLDPYVYKVVFDDTATPEKILSDFILKQNSFFFFSSIPKLSEEKYTKNLHWAYYKAFPDSTHSANPFAYHVEKRGISADSKLWIIDTSSFYDFRFIDVATHLKFHHSRGAIAQYPTSQWHYFLKLEEAWELDELGDSLSWIDLSSFKLSPFPNSIPHSPFKLFLTKSYGESIATINVYLNRHNNTIKTWDSPEEKIRKILQSQPGKLSQIQLLMDVSDFEYRDIETPYAHLQGIPQKMVMLPSEPDSFGAFRRTRIAANNPIVPQEMAFRRGGGARASSRIGASRASISTQRSQKKDERKDRLLRFEIVFEDDPLFVDIYGRTKIDLETHLRALKVKHYQYDSAKRSWKAVQPVPCEGREPARRRSHPIGVDQAKPNTQSAPDVPSSNTSNTGDSALPPLDSKNSLPPVAPSTLEKPKLREDRKPKPKVQGKEQPEQNALGTGKNHPRNRRRREIKRLKQALEPYPDLKAMFEAEVLPSDLEELNTIAKYYDLKIKYKNNQAL